MPISIFSGRFTQGGRAVRPDPTVDRIMDSLEGESRGKMRETTGMVTLTVLPASGTNDTLPIDLSLNGVTYRLYYNQTVTIPCELANILLNSATGRTTSAPIVGPRGEMARSDQSGNIVAGMRTVDCGRWRVEIERED
jgi:hypothetical protein